MKFYSKMLVAVLLITSTCILSSCSDDDNSNPSVKVEVSEISGTSALISWNIISEEVITHEIIIKDKATGTICFEETTGLSFTSGAVETEVEATGLSSETEYTVTVTANTIDSEFNAVYVGEGSADFTTTEGAALLEVTKEEIVGMWTCSNRYYKFDDDGTGETGSHSDTFGDEKEDDITWEITSYEYDGNEVRSIKATDSEGYWNDMEVVKENDVIKLIDHDNSWTFTTADDNGGDEGTYSTSDFEGSEFKSDNEAITIRFNGDGSFEYYAGTIDMLSGNSYEWKLEGSEIKSYKTGDYSFVWYNWLIDDMNTIHLLYSDVILRRQ